MKIETEFDIDEIVFDDLTNKEAKIIGITFSSGYVNENHFAFQCNNIGYWVDNDYLGGGRHPWEISKC